MHHIIINDLPFLIYQLVIP